MKAGRPSVDDWEVGELLHHLELVSVTPYGEHALDGFPIPLVPEADCVPGHGDCLALHCRVGGRYLRLHLSRRDAVRLSHLLYYRASPDPMAELAT